MPLIDSHCHLDFDAFEADREEVIARARQAGVEDMLTICTSLHGFDRVRRIAETHERIYCTVGVHPHEADREGVRDAAPLIALAKRPKVIGIGETGLDYYYEHSDRQRQKQSFLSHIEAARETGLPLVIHSRDADSDMAEILTAEMEKGRFSAVLHCFSSGAALAERALELGFYISFSGIVTFKNAQSVRAIAASIPLDRVLVETDAPYLAPVPKRGRRNEPALVVHTARCLAQLKGMPVEELARQTCENFFRLFHKAPRPGGTDI